MTAALVLLLAQTCIAEIDFPSNTTECVAMWEINANTAKRRSITIAQQTRQFNTYWRSPTRQARKPWIKHLNADGDQPKGWPKGTRWDRHRGRWLRVLARAKRFVRDWNRGKYRRVCRGAQDYGGRTHPKPCARAVLVDCLPGSSQSYWSIKGCRAARRAS